MSHENTVNIKKLAETSQLKSGDFLIVETPDGTRILDYKNFTVDLTSTTFASTISALETGVGRPVDGTDTETSSNYSLIQQLTGSDSVKWSANILNSMLYTLSSVGIGIASPSRKLHIAGTTGDGRMRISNSGTDSSSVIDFENDAVSAEIGIYAGASDAFQIWTGNPTIAARLTVDTSGNVGIGTAQPLDSLHLADGGKVRIEKTDVPGRYTHYEYASVNVAPENDGWTIKLGGDNIVKVINGNVGIGTTEPNHALTIQGSISAVGSLSATGGGYNYFTNNVGIGTATPSALLTVHGALCAQNISSNGTVNMQNLPTSDPSVAGQLYNASGAVKVSAG